MINVTMLQTITESATGYTGGPAVDTMPHIGLYEAAGMLPVAIMESQQAFSAVRSNSIAALSEAAEMAISTGSAADFGPVVEATWGDLKAKVKAFFDKIIKFLDSIIAKLKIQMDKITKTGRQLYDKYKDSPNYRGKNYKDLTVSGYKFHGNGAARPFGEGVAEFTSDSKIGELLKAATGTEVPDPYAFQTSHGNKHYEAGSQAADSVKEEINKLTDISTAERQHKMAEKVVGSVASLSEGSWASDIRKELWGDKADIKYGEETFTESWISSVLGKADAIDAITKDYTQMKKNAEAYNKKLQAEVDKIEKEISARRKSTSGASEADRKNADNTNNAQSDISAYFNAYMGLVHDAYGVITSLKNIELDYEKARLAQAKTFFGKMLSYNDKKNNSDAADAEDLAILDAEL
ncbi:MAG: hypothetical protein NC311_05760 [Muribaculaceae bacterium]|nr:hypothetical protein [Muribaculaceae bacterium]